MRNDTRSNQVSQIVRQLAELPGGLAMNITSKKFPQFGRGSELTSYEERTRTFAADTIPSALVVPADVEEVIIKLEGTLAPARKDELVEKIQSMLVENGLAKYWETRANFAAASTESSRYELTVFTNPTPGASA